jgi:hypothetical protein
MKKFRFNPSRMKTAKLREKKGGRGPFLFRRSCKPSYAILAEKVDAMSARTYNERHSDGKNITMSRVKLDVW